MTQRWTLRSLLDWCVDYFKKHEVDSPRLDAELLLAHTLGVKRIQLYMDLERPMIDSELSAFKALILRRAKEHEPIAYILGERGFWTLDLKVNPHVLIPRPETELLVERALEVARDLQGEPDAAPTPLNIVDVGTGSGAIALALAQELPGASVWATDISSDALVVAAENAARHDLSERVSFLEGDLLGPLPEQARPLDIIVSNPPYIADDEAKDLAANVLDHEPHMALFAGPDGLRVYDRLIPLAVAALRPGGALLCEIGATQGPAVSQRFTNAGLVDVIVHQDLAGHDRVVQGRLA